MYKAKANSQCGRDIVGSERWQQKLQQQSHILSASGVIRGYHVYQTMWTPHVGEKATIVRESGNEHDQFTVAVLEDS